MPGKIWPANDTPTQRLSKPRTNTSSSNLLSHLSQPSSPLTPSEPSLSSEKATVKASQNGERRSRRQSRSKIREYLHGQSSGEEDDQKQKGSKRGIRERLSWSSSSLINLTNGKSSSTQPLNHSNRELDDENSERTRREITRKALTDSVAARNHVPEPVDEDKHPDAMKSPIRRRSLYTPGLATRSPDDLLRKPPQHGNQIEQSGGHRYRTEVPSSSPLDDLAALAVSRNAALMNSNAGRSTPTDFEQLGGLGLGTLRIMNDTASQQHSSSHTYPPTASSTSHEDAEYFTASEGTRSEDGSSVLNMVDLSSDRTPKHQRRSNSPLKYENQWGTVKSQRSPVASPEKSPLNKNGRTLASAENQSEGYFSPSTVLQSPDRASVFAQDYMSELPPSPYKSALPTADTAVNSSVTCAPTQGKTTEISEISENQLQRENLWQSFLNNEAEARHAHNTTSEDAYRVLNGEVAPRDLSRTPSNQRADFPTGDRGNHCRYDSLSTTASNTLSRSNGSSGSERVIKQVPATKLLPLNFVDSGYSSKDDIPKALRGELRDDHAPDLDDRWSKHQHSTSDPQDETIVPLRGTEAYDPSADCCRIDPVRPALEVVPRPQTTITTCSYSIPHSQSQPMVPTLNPLPAHDNSPAVAPGSDSSPHDSISASKPTLRSKPSGTDPQFQPPSGEISPQKNRKLQKSKRISKSFPIDMTATQEISNITDLDIPIIPPALASKHAERFREFPTLDHTYTNHESESPGGSRSSSNEISMPIRFPSPPDPIEQRSNAIINPDISWPTKASKKKSKELKAEQAAATRKLDRRMSQGEALGVIADFGTVADSLGNNPYDIAKPKDPLRPKSIITSNTNRCHPHQMSTNMPRAKSIIGMDDAAAAEASRFRSERSSQIRPQSMFAGEAPSRLPVDGSGSHRGSGNRSHQSLENFQTRNAPIDVPPVPHLPSADETQYLEAVARRDFQQEVPVVQKARSSNRPAKLVRPKSMYGSTSYVPVYPGPTQMSSKRPLKEAKVKSGQSNRPRSLINEGFQPDRPVVKDIEHNATVVQQRSSSWLVNRSQNPWNTSQMLGSPQESLANLGSFWSAQSDYAKQVHDAVSNNNKLKKQRPGSVKPDMWKSDSLKEKAKENSTTSYTKEDSSRSIAQPHEQTKDFEEGNTPQQKQIAPQPGTWEDFTQAYAKRRQFLEGDGLLSNDQRPDSQLSQPVAAPSLHDALSAHKKKNYPPIEVSPMVSITETPQDLTRSPISPVSTMHYDTPISPAGQRSYVSLAPSPKATRSPPKNTNGTTTPAVQRLRSPPPTMVDGMPVGDLDVLDYRLDDHARHGGSSNKEENHWCRKPTASPPKTPKKRISLNGTSLTNLSLTICNPAATAADSYRSQTDAAPAPPPFSVPRKRISSLICFNPTPSARSLKPVRPVSGTTSAADTPPRDDSASTSDSSQHNTPPPPPPPTSQPPTPIGRNSLPPPQQHSNGSPIKVSARSSAAKLSPPPKHFPPVPAPPASCLPLHGPIYPTSRFENLSGRYQGGLEYGYEPGVGIGGSAGTRVPKTGATRKSVDVGKMYGIDLSDVPIFVKHGPQRE